MALESATRGRAVFCEVQRVVALETGFAACWNDRPATLAQCERSVRPRPPLDQWRVVLMLAYGRDVAGNPQGLPVMVSFPGLQTLSLFPPAPFFEGCGSGHHTGADMGKREVLTVTGAVQIDHKLSRVISTIKKANETLAVQRASLTADKADLIELVEVSMTCAQISAQLSRTLYKFMRSSLRPMDADERRLIDELADNGVIPKI